jgi:hypothetical protein
VRHEAGDAGQHARPAGEVAAGHGLRRAEGERTTEHRQAREELL